MEEVTEELIKNVGIEFQKLLPLQLGNVEAGGNSCSDMKVNRLQSLRKFEKLDMMNVGEENAIQVNIGIQLDNIQVGGRCRITIGVIRSMRNTDISFRGLRLKGKITIDLMQSNIKIDDLKVVGSWGFRMDRGVVGLLVNTFIRSTVARQIQQGIDQSVSKVVGQTHFFDPKMLEKLQG